MDTNGHELTTRTGNSLFDRVIIILEQARTNVVRTVNSEMVLAYWHIGREIVQELQKGEDRAEYGKQIIKALSAKLNEKYGKGFSTTNLWYFRQFYVVYSNREPKIRHKACGELISGEKLHKACGVLGDLSLAVEKSEDIQGFSPSLSWSHYRTLTKSGVVERIGLKHMLFGKQGLYCANKREIAQSRHNAIGVTL
jgi:hypothetical protein